ncbi:hypothetical protein ANN_04951 [Periplaneta americana]|uniref:CRAL-TRIO domain-containing protein n=1 Tax=Periplaneta americana TaxID=6978 RepID=A0ABQ8TBH6_PERAM|nr:hypothetical protein ANN_04951 [Periplaneta americana]
MKICYGCETWTITLREEHRLRVFENKMLRKIFGAKRDEVTREWRKLHNTELHALYSSPDIIRNIKSRRLRWAEHVARMGESRNAYRVLVGRPEGKRPLGRPRRRWEDNIKMDLREVGYDDREWINLAQDRDQWRAYVRAAMNLRITVHLTAESRPTSHSTECAPNIMAVDIGHISQHICLTRSQATKGNIEGGGFGPVLWIGFGEAQVCIPLPGTDDEGRRITLIRSGIYDASKVKVENVFKVSFMVTDVLMEEDDAIVVNGNIAIIDLAGVTLGHAAQMTPSVVKKLMTTSQVTTKAIVKITFTIKLQEAINTQQEQSKESEQILLPTQD